MFRSIPIISAFNEHFLQRSFLGEIVLNKRGARRGGPIALWFFGEGHDVRARTNERWIGFDGV